MSNDLENEYRTDVPTDEIPHRSTWSSLSPNELISVKLKLENRLYELGSNPVIAASLASGIAELERLILQK